MEITVSTVYTLGMPKFVYVHVKGAEKPSKIRADKVEEVATGDLVRGLLVVKSGDQPIGKFKQAEVQGWWIEDEPDDKK